MGREAGPSWLLSYEIMPPTNPDSTCMLNMAIFVSVHCYLGKLWALIHSNLKCQMSPDFWCSSDRKFSNSQVWSIIIIIIIEKVTNPPFRLIQCRLSQHKTMQTLIQTDISMRESYNSWQRQSQRRLLSHQTASLLLVSASFVCISLRPRHARQIESVSVQFRCLEKARRSYQLALITTLLRLTPHLHLCS